MGNEKRLFSQILPAIISAENSLREEMHIRAVIFDWDGPIADSFREGLRRIRILCAVHEIPFGIQERKRLTEIWGRPGIELLQEGLDVSKGLAEQMYPEWERMDLHDPVPLVPGTREVLFWLRRNGLQSALLTSRHKNSLNDILDRLDLGKEFSVITSKEETLYHKPDHRVFYHTLEQLKEKHGILKKECVFMGDTPADIVAGQNAGIRTVVVQTGPYLLKHTKDYPIDLGDILNSIDDLPFWIEEHHKGEMTFPYQ